jgi:hypothetical protein
LLRENGWPDVGAPLEREVGQHFAHSLQSIRSGKGVRTLQSASREDGLGTRLYWTLLPPDRQVLDLLRLTSCHSHLLQKLVRAGHGRAGVDDWTFLAVGLIEHEVATAIWA